MGVAGSDVDWAYLQSTPTTPILFILSPGVDPFPILDNLSKRQQVELTSISLGRGQGKRAREKITDGIKAGQWVYLANCHLSLQFLVDLEKTIEALRGEKKEKNEKMEFFRLWLSSNPHPKFPISILQHSVKITTEPPRGLRNNMLRSYKNLPDNSWGRVREKDKYKKLLFSLCWFHAVIIERKHFKSLGWNVMYDFNDSDFSICESIIAKYLDDNSEGQGKVPWAAMRYLIADANYGGRVTDEWDRRLLMVYANSFFNEKILSEEKYLLTDDSALPYFIPDDVGWKPPSEIASNKAINLTQAFYELKIKELPPIDPPAAFGQHINAEISSQIADAFALIESIISLQPKKYIETDDSSENPIDRIIVSLLEKIPDPMDIEVVKDKIRVTDKDPLKIVLVQEIIRYNKLLTKVRTSLANLEKGLKGLILISEDLENILNSLIDGKVPASWGYAYHSLKALASWVDDLCKRMDQLSNWVYKGRPIHFWISGFTFPTGFTTAVRQESARLKGVSVDTLDFEYNVLIEPPYAAPKEGVYISGLYLEGGKWDTQKNYLIDAEPMKLQESMPAIHLKPKNIKLVPKRHFPQYNCPVYMYPIRTGVREKPSFMFSVSLNCHPNFDSDFWVKRGTALLMSIAD
jgi:dynein heavy chain